MAANQAFQKLYGWNINESTRRLNSFQLFREALEDEFTKLKERVTNGENARPHHPTFRLRKDEKRSRRSPTSLSLSAVKDDTGKIKALSSVTHDLKTEYLETQKINQKTKRIANNTKKN